MMYNQRKEGEQGTTVERTARLETLARAILAKKSDGAVFGPRIYGSLNVRWIVNPRFMGQNMLEFGSHVLAARFTAVKISFR